MLGQTILDNCCSQVSLVQYFNSLTGDSGPSLTTAAPDSNLVVCSTALNDVSLCANNIPGFSTFDMDQQASCLCYDSDMSWDPNAFDGPWSSCVAWAETSNQTLYTELLSDSGFCASVGNILTAPASGVAASTTAGGATQASASSPVTATPGSGSGSGARTFTTSTGGTAQATSSNTGVSNMRTIKSGARTFTTSTGGTAQATSSNTGVSNMRTIKSGAMASLMFGLGLCLAV